MEKVFVAQRVATKLFATEQSIDGSMTEAAELMVELMKARQDARVSAVVGDEAQVKLAEAIAALSAARSAVVACHNQLAETKLRMGIRTKMIGTGDKDDQQQFAALTGDKRAVG